MEDDLEFGIPILVVLLFLPVLGSLDIIIKIPLEAVLLLCSLLLVRSLELKAQAAVEK